jgi:hypothetical protein
MSQSPYANLGTEVLEPIPQRTSVLAILSLVIAIISIVPLFCVFLGSGALAVIFGGAALLFINRERGRLSGTGLAATGIVLGLMVTVLQIVVVMMVTKAMQFYKQNIIGPIDTALVALDSGDLKTARTMFPPSADAKITDEMLQQFVTDYQARIGAYKGAPDTLWGAIQLIVQVGPGMQGMQGRNDVIPFPAKFEKGPAVVAIMFDPTSTSRGSAPGGAAMTFSVINLGVLTPDQKEVWLVDPATIPLQRGPVRITPGGRTGPVEIEINPPAPPPADPELPEAPKPAPEPANAPG